MFVRGRSGFGKLKAERPAASLENPDILEIVVHVPDACRCRRSRTRHESLRMANTSVEVPGLTAQLDRLVHHHGGKCLPEGTPHAFVYFITIKNDSDRVVTLLGRKWMIVQADGSRVVIEGEKIVGESPRLAPGEHFSYNSYHVTGGNARAHGSFHGVDEFGGQVRVMLEPFDLVIPEE